MGLAGRRPRRRRARRLNPRVRVRARVRVRVSVRVGVRVRFRFRVRVRVKGHSGHQLRHPIEALRARSLHLRRGRYLGNYAWTLPPPS